MKERLTRLLCLVTLMAVASVAEGADKGLLVMRVRGVTITDKDVIQSALPIWAYSLRNLETRQVVTNTSPGRAWAVEVEGGIYCLDSVKFFGNVFVDYCGEPYFKVEAGSVNNVGRWAFGITGNLNRYKLVYAVHELESTLEDAKPFNEELFAKYSRKAPPALANAGSSVAP